MKKQNWNYGQKMGQPSAERIDRGLEHMLGYTSDFFEDMGYCLCKKCRRRNIDRSENPDSVLCKECREELIKLKIPKVFYIAGAAVLILTVSIMILSMGSFKDSIAYNVDRLVDEGYVITAIDNLAALLERQPDFSHKAIELADIGMEYGYYDTAAYAISNYLTEVDLSGNDYVKITGYVSRLNTYYATCELSEQIWGDISENMDQTDDPYAMLETYNQKLSQYIGNEEYDQALIYYYLGCMSADNEKRIEYFQKCIEINSSYFEAQAQIAVYYRRKGDLEKARQILEETYKVNKEDYAILRAFATLELTEGNLESGLDFASSAYEMYEEGAYVIDTYIIALAANGRIEEARMLASEYEDNYFFDEELYDFLDGNVTLEEYYMGD